MAPCVERGDGDLQVLAQFFRGEQLVKLIHVRIVPTNPVSSLQFQCQQPCHSVAISTVSPGQRPFRDCSNPAHSCPFRRCRWWGSGVPDRVTDTLLTGLWCLVADMEPVDSSDHRVDWDVVVCLVWMGLWNSRTETLMASIPDSSRELTQQTPLDHLRVPPTSEDKIILSEAPGVHARTDRVNQVVSTQVRVLSTNRLLRHTHLQRVAPCMKPDGSGGGWC